MGSLFSQPSSESYIPSKKKSFPLSQDIEYNELLYRMICPQLLENDYTSESPCVQSEMAYKSTNVQSIMEIKRKDTWIGDMNAKRP